ncbi:hypothetical protein POM88_019448 [Heracleum sosnowskyi]|uniref:PB1-like domain-containing protein n=1 Tax=Heracleum sosnowskyi TaxID=360622 RepID=A0AAD8IAN2_9APIA|nr:hypothetical protein POM88_019448 [Heracleum sosnowskyi]
MRGRLRDVFDADNLLKAKKLKSEAESSEGDENIVIDYGLPDGKEYPDYEEISPYFSIKLHFGGKFDFGFNQYFGGEIAYFDMCSVKKLTLTEMEAMYSEVGCSTEKMDFWLLSNELEVGCSTEKMDFWFSVIISWQDQRIERIEDIRVEIEGIAYDEATEDDEEEEKASLHGDSSNMDSKDTPVILDDSTDVVPTEKKNCDKKKSDGQISNHEASKKSKGETSNANKHPTTV